MLGCYSTYHSILHLIIPSRFGHYSLVSRTSCMSSLFHLSRLCVQLPVPFMVPSLFTIVARSSRSALLPTHSIFFHYFLVIWSALFKTTYKKYLYFILFTLWLIIEVNKFIFLKICFTWSGNITGNFHNFTYSSLKGYSF